jgi:hypothetical protein
MKAEAAQSAVDNTGCGGHHVDSGRPDLLVVRVQDELWGWRVTETPYGRTAGNQPSSTVDRSGG